MWFEEHRVGQRAVSPEQLVGVHDAELDAEPDLAATHASAEPDPAGGLGGRETAHAASEPDLPAAVALLRELGVVDGAVREFRWHAHAPVLAGDVVRAETVVTRCRWTPPRDAGIVHRHFRVVGRDGQLLQDGTTATLTPARGPAPSPSDAEARADFCSPDWARQLAAALGDNDEFLEATQTFDGAIGLRAGDEDVQLRVYRGTILDCGRSTPLGATFTLAGDELAWTELAFAERNEFVADTTRGRFSVTGSAYEYLRLTKALVAVWDEVRALAAEGEAP